MKEKKKVW